MSWPHARPRVLFSRCLDGDPCRYDGDRVPDAFIGRLRAHVEAVNVCPEVDIGLGVPRPPIRLVTGDSLRLVEPSTGRDLTDTMAAYTTRTLRDLSTLDGAVLKSRSPSCGLGDAKIYDAIDADDPVERGHGLFGRGLSEALGELAITDEARLIEPSHRRAFLERLFALALLRKAAPSPDLAARMGHLLAQDEAYHRATLEAALARAATGPTRRTIMEALSHGPRRDPASPALYPTGLEST